jgi:hypothetical protein
VPPNNVCPVPVVQRRWRSNHDQSSGATPLSVPRVVRKSRTVATPPTQREGNQIIGFSQLRQYKDVSNFSVGLFCQQAGLSLDESLRIAGGNARFFSSNANRDQPFGLDQRTRDLITTGYDIGAHGVFGQAATPP